MMQKQAEKEGNQRVDGLFAFFGRGPPPADPQLFWDFTTLTFLQRLNSSLLILSSFSLLLGMIAYVYGAALAMIAPILCHLWLQLNVTMFRQALHYLICMVAYVSTP
ncbi:hypothetical protein AAVH_12928 [Aphelenchoides avenae]|nr:hypothetical protein AAVH_12928 [Aphelenchus avenae]